MFYNYFLFYHVKRDVIILLYKTHARHSYYYYYDCKNFWMRNAYDSEGYN